MVEEDQVSAARLQNSGGKVENPEEKRLNNHIQSFIKCFLIFFLTCRLVSVTLLPVFVCFHTYLDWFHVSPVTLSVLLSSQSWMSDSRWENLQLPTYKNSKFDAKY